MINLNINASNGYALAKRPSISNRIWEFLLYAFYKKKKDTLKDKRCRRLKVKRQKKKRYAMQGAGIATLIPD